MEHDILCINYDGPCCPWLGSCDCQCTCDEIYAIRADERAMTVGAMVDLLDSYEEALHDLYSPESKEAISRFGDCTISQWIYFEQGLRAAIQILIDGQTPVGLLRGES